MQNIVLIKTEYFQQVFSRKKIISKLKLYRHLHSCLQYWLYAGFFVFFLRYDTVRFWHIASYFVFCKSVVLWEKKNKKTKETIFQYLYSNAVICSLILFSTYPVCIYFSCTFSLGPQPILGESSSVSHWNDSSSLEGAPVSSLSHSERLAPLAEFRWALLARFL